MQYTSFALAAAFASTVVAAPGGTPIIKARADSLTLEQSAIQSGSFVDGSTSIGSAEVGQAKSAISTNNFINNCAGKTLTNGLQITTGSCNGITMGDIPAKTAMVSSIITFPTTGGKSIASDTDFNITVQMSNLVAGSFTNADATYYAAPQTLSGGLVVGHTHVTVQDLGNSLNPTTALDATKFAFFKGINDAGNGKGLLTAVVTGGLPAGNYRVCTMASASNHQPVLMPVAQRGTADDCTKFTVSGSGTTENPAANDGANGIAAASLAAEAVQVATNPALAASASKAALAAADSTAVAAATTTAKSNGKGKGTGGNNNAAGAATTTAASATKAAKGGNNNGATSATSSASVAAVSTTKSGKGKNGGSQATAVANAGTNNKGGKFGGKGNFVTSATASAPVAVESTAAAATETATTSGDNVQTFTGALGGLPPAVIFTAGAERPFAVDGSTFINSGAALQRSCSVQHNACADAANSGTLAGGESQCETQINECNAAIAATKKRFVFLGNSFHRTRGTKLSRRKFIV